MNTDDNDVERLRKVQAAFEEIRRGDVSPVFSLTAGPISRVSRGSFGRPPRIWISHAAADTDPRGDVGHEYAHLLDRAHWRDTILQAVGFTVLALTGLGGAILYPVAVAPGSAPHVGALLGVWLGGWAALTAALLWAAHFSHRIELRADQTAAELLGEPGPLLTMLDRLHDVRAGYTRRQRIVARITHPDPARRRRLLTQ